MEWIESKGEGAKLVQRWIGPFEILQHINLKTYRLRLDDCYLGFPIFNYNLMPYKEPSAEFGPRLTLADTRTRKPATEEYKVEKIIGKCFDKSKKQNL
jgi:arginyl-tRNA--protein-N-Asp/Glu arginylyltransferase